MEKKVNQWRRVDTVEWKGGNDLQTIGRHSFSNTSQCKTRAWQAVKNQIKWLKRFSNKFNDQNDFVSKVVFPFLSFFFETKWFLLNKVVFWTKWVYFIVETNDLYVQNYLLRNTNFRCLWSTTSNPASSETHRAREIVFTICSCGRERECKRDRSWEEKRGGNMKERKS